LTGAFPKRGDTTVDFTNFVDVDTPAIALDLAAIGDLAARLDIKRSLAQHYGDAPVRQISFRNDLGADVEKIVADEGSRLIALRPVSLAEYILANAELF